MKRVLLRSPGFLRDLRSWLKSHSDTKASIEATLEQLSDDPSHPSLRTHKFAGRWQAAGLVALGMICVSSSRTSSMRDPRQ